MDITVKVDIPKADASELARILGVSSTDLADELAKYTAAAVREYAAMFLGQKVFSRGSDILEHRLFLLTEEAFGNRIPDEQEVSHLFQTTATESRSLIRSVMSKYQYLLKAAIDNSLEKIIKAAKPEPGNGPYTVVINSQNLVEELNRTLAEIDGSLPLVSKERGSVSTYIIQRSSYERIKKHIS